MSKILRAIRRHFRGRRFFFGPQVFHAQSHIFSRARLSVQFYYLTLFAVAVDVTSYNRHQLQHSTFSNPLWPLRILGWPDAKPWLIDLTFVMLLGGALGAIVFSGWRVFRVAAFMGLFYLLALQNSDGLFSNHMHMALFPTFLLIFLPNAVPGADRSRRQAYLSWFWFAQFAICFAYGMAGYFKVLEIFRCIAVRGLDQCEVGSAIMTSMAAKELLQFGRPTFAGDLLYQFPLIGGLSYLFIIWFHLVSPYFAFRFDLHRLFLALRIIFHFGTLILFGIGFSYTILAVVGMFAFSPFVPPIQKFRWREFFGRLPTLGWVRA